MKFIINLWPPAIDFFQEILEELSLEYEILKYTDYNFTNKEDFEEFVREIYKIDGAVERSINRKIDFFTDLHHRKVKRFDNYNSDNYIIRCIHFDIPNPVFRPRGSDGKPISIETEAIKKYYRNKYSGKIENYIYDIIIHIGDNDIQTEKILTLLENYIQFKVCD